MGQGVQAVEPAEGEKVPAGHAVTAVAALEAATPEMEVKDPAEAVYTE